MTDSEIKPNIQEDDLDLSDDFESDIEGVDNDFDEDGEDGIFAPGAQKKKSNFKLTILIVALALLCGGGLYFYTQRNSLNGSAAVSSPQSPPVQTSGLPGVPSPASDFAAAPPVPPTDPAGQAFPDALSSSPDAVVLNQPSPDPAPDVPKADETAVSVSEVGSGSDAKAPLISDKQISQEAEVDSVPAPVSPPVQPLPAPKTSDAGFNANPPVQDSIAASADVTTASEPASTPDASVLTPVTPDAQPAVRKKNELEAARETINLQPEPKKKKAADETVYFDSPKGKVLTDIPPPSIDPMRQPGESIIIVRRPGGKDESVMVQKGDESELIETRLVNAGRAAKLGMNDEALQFYNELYRKNPHDPRILMGRAVTLQKLGETQQAIEGYRKVLDIESENPEAITNLMGLIGKTQPAVALQNLLELGEKYPRNAPVAAQLGVAYAQSGNPEDGLKYLNIAAGLQPKNPLHYYNMAVIYEQQANRAEAIKYYEKALDIYSVHGGNEKMSFTREEIYDRLAGLRGN